MISETDKAYMAATIDDEGCIGMRICGNKTCATLLLTVVNTDYRLIEWIEKVFGGHHATRYRDIGKGYFYTWRVTCSTAQEVLRIVMPYLIIKHEQAVEALKATYNGTGIGITEQERALRQNIRKNIMELNNTSRKFPKGA